MALLGIASAAFAQTTESEAVFLPPPAGQPAGKPAMACKDLYALTGFFFTIESAELVPAEGQSP